MSVYQRIPTIGEVINIISSPIMLMTYPGQTEATLFIKSTR